MRRREFITLIGGAAAGWPLAALAQQPSLPVVGFLHSRSPEDTHLVAGLQRGLAETGYVDGESVTIEYRWGRGRYDLMPALAAELVGRRAAVLVAGGGLPVALAAKAATSTTPVIFVMGSDPVETGLVASYNRPGGNVTGINILTMMLEPKRLGLLCELMPQATSIGVLLNPGFLPSAGQLKDVQEAARAMDLRIHVLRAGTESEIEAAFETVARERIAALAVAAAPFFDIRRDQLVALSARYRLPAIYHFREYAAAGGLMSYGTDLPDAYRQVGLYAGRILKGTKPADLPVMQPTKFEFVINLKTAKALDLEVPPTLIARADEVIE
jgi:ABC-type uncharacterized transport system substrate-binding protein